MKGYFIFGVIFALIFTNSYFGFYEIPYTQYLIPPSIIFIGALLFRNRKFLDKALGGLIILFGILKIALSFGTEIPFINKLGDINIILGILALILILKSMFWGIKIRKVKGAEIISCKGGNNVILSDFTKNHILEHAKPGKGSIFGKIKMSDIREIISSIPSRKFNKEGGPGLVTFKIKNAGYNLVEKTADIAKKYNILNVGETAKLDRGEEIKVPVYTISNNLEEFKTNQFTVIIVTSNPKFMEKKLKQDPRILKDLQKGKSFSVVTAFPGDPNVPPAGQWEKTTHAIIIPDSGKDI